MKKQRHYFANKGPSSQGYGFSCGHVWMWELDCEESWVPKNWCFWTWCWRRLLRVPWTARRSNQSILKEISPGCSLEGLMLKLKLQYFGHLIRRVDSWEKTQMLGGTGGRRRRGWQRMRWMDSITDSMDVSLSELRELVMDRRPGMLWFMGLQRVRHDWVTELNWLSEVFPKCLPQGTLRSRVLLLAKKTQQTQAHLPIRQKLTTEITARSQEISLQPFAKFQLSFYTVILKWNIWASNSLLKASVSYSWNYTWSHGQVDSVGHPEPLCTPCMVILLSVLPQRVWDLCTFSCETILRMEANLRTLDLRAPAPVSCWSHTFCSLCGSWTALTVAAPSWHHTLPLLPFPDTIFSNYNGTPLQYSCLESPIDEGAW